MNFIYRLIDSTILNMLYICIAFLVLIIISLLVAFKKRKKTEEQYRLAIDGSNDIIWDWDLIENRIQVYPRGQDIYRVKECDFVLNPEDLKDIVHPSDFKANSKELNNHLNKVVPYFYHEVRLKRRTGTYSTYLARGKAVWNSSGKAIRMVGSLTDITKLKQWEEEVYELAHYDSLTGLPNRTLLKKKLRTAMANADSQEKVALLFINLDNFKTVNDTMGLDSGDKILIQASHSLEQISPSDSTVARLGGDEFVILIHGVTESNQLTTLANNVLQEFSKPFVIGDRRFFITASIGISFFPDHGENEDLLLKNAGIALHEVKTAGGNNYYFCTQELNDHIINKLNMEANMRQGLLQNDFFLVYQPLIELATGKVVGVEALLRWKLNGNETVSPGNFIPIAEETGFIIQLGEWVLETACKQNKAWQEAGLDPIFVSVNLSARQFQSQDIHKTVSSVLETTNLDPCWLKLEITETAAIDNPLYTIETLTSLQEMGVTTSLDDFGTGYSSLNYLRLLNVNNIKIDKSFISNAMDVPIEKEIIKAIISLAHGINLTVTAEGVETERQLNFLRGLNCNLVQGYYYSKPLKANDLAALLRQGSHLLSKTD
ncbi:diguanylate cyclase (GGDEF)-like protein [Desulfitispora alkaliphila]|uniref:putative bifunctional diguanylate cyclase/phosphodiesterase n=1 Tax=Desulfitispora alkaliphila TaxID=622674 RepID=UPI003D193D61